MTATKVYRAGALREAGFRLFRDGHVKMVRVHHGSTSVNLYLIHAVVKPSFKTTRQYCTVVGLSKSTGYVASARCKFKAGANRYCKHVAALLYNILDYVELGPFLMIRHVPISPSSGIDLRPMLKVVRYSFLNRPKTDAEGGPILFYEIQFVHHTYGKRKAETAATRMHKVKKYHACPVLLQRVSEERIRHFCTSLESHQKLSLFAIVMLANDCTPLPLEAVLPATVQDSVDPIDTNVLTSGSSQVARTLQEIEDVSPATAVSLQVQVDQDISTSGSSQVVQQG